MEILKLGEEGSFTAKVGLGLSYGLTSNMHVSDIVFNKELMDKLYDLACKLSKRDNGENKFLESIIVWLDIRAPRYWWQEFDTYRVGVSKQSESTMHTIMKRKLTQNDFEKPIPQQLLHSINECIESKMFEEVKNLLPEGFLQRRIVSINYKSLRHIIIQRRGHRLPQWKQFCDEIMRCVNYPEWLEIEEKENEQ